MYKPLREEWCGAVENHALVLVLALQSALAIALFVNLWVPGGQCEALYDIIMDLTEIFHNGTNAVFVNHKNSM